MTGSKRETGNYEEDGREEQKYRGEEEEERPTMSGWGLNETF